ncbi:unnamed protein product [Adineta ricciae]|uniref:EGF-like domain-containing protein n=1 Tax=Adineta ricciae TaxID=249248 RepID=A0A815A804_ADIRI|nr:unnamed protein product [Adineta ricciae]
MLLRSQCLDVFVDVNNTFYCCLDGENKVIKISLNNKSSSVSLVAGNGTSGNSSYLLNNPNGIFVDVNRDLYVADRSNNRIQLYRQGSLNGTTINVTGALTPAGLLNPSGVTLDGAGYLFIVDRGYNRLLASGSNGFRCVAACSSTGTSGSESSQLKDPQKILIFYLINNASQTTTTTSTSTTSVTFISMTSTTLTITRVTALSIQTALMSTSCTLQSSTDVHSSDIASIYSFSTDNAITTTKSGITSITHYNRRFFLSMSTAPFFIAPSCSNTTNIGLYCNISSSHCSMLDPCRNNATCNNLTNSDQGYVCSCPAGFNSTQCQLNYQSCKPTTCLNNGAHSLLSSSKKRT